jgi:hypothetical protein
MESSSEALLSPSADLLGDSTLLGASPMRSSSFSSSYKKSEFQRMNLPEQHSQPQRKLIEKLARLR